MRKLSLGLVVILFLCASSSARASEPLITDVAGDAGWVTGPQGGALSDARVDVLEADVANTATTLSFTISVADLDGAPAPSAGVATHYDLFAPPPDLNYTVTFDHAGTRYEVLVKLDHYYEPGYSSVGQRDCTLRAPLELSPGVARPDAEAVTVGSCFPVLDVAANRVAATFDLTAVNSRLAELGFAGFASGDSLTGLVVKSFVSDSYVFTLGGNDQAGDGSATYTLS